MGERVVAFAACLFGCGFEHGQGRTVDAAGPDVATMDDAPIDSPKDLVCPATYMTTLASSASMYRLIPLNQDFWAHDQDCNDDSAGSTHLAVIDSAAELDELSKVANASILKPNNSWYLVGCVQRPGQAAPALEWHWFTGAAVPASVWGSFGGSPQPNDADDVENNEENLCMLEAPQSKLLDGTGSNVAGYGAVCECDGRAMDPAVRADIPPKM